MSCQDVSPFSKIQIHLVKTIPVYFEMAKRRAKCFELRYNDRNYQIGDTLIQCEWDPNTKQYTGRRIRGIISSVVSDTAYLQPGYVALGLVDMEDYYEPQDQ